MIDKKEVEELLNLLEIPLFKCFRCGDKFFWMRNIRGKGIPVSLNFENHFNECKRIYRPDQINKYQYR